MLVLAIIDGPSDGDVGEETTEEAPVEDPEGSNFERRLPVPRGEFTAVESLEIENCALRIDRSAVCWQQSF